MPFPPPDLFNLGIEPRSPALAGGFFATEPAGKHHLRNENAPKFPIYPTTRFHNVTDLSKARKVYDQSSHQPDPTNLRTELKAFLAWPGSAPFILPTVTPLQTGSIPSLVSRYHVLGAPTHSLHRPVIQQQPLLKSAQVSWHTLSIFGPIQPITASSRITNVSSRKHTSMDDTMHDLRNTYGALITTDGLKKKKMHSAYRLALKKR